MQPKSHRRGFTLVELLISTSLAAVVMTGVLSTFTFLGRNLARMASYQALENEARTGLAYLRQDFAVARGVKAGTSPTASTVTLVLPAGEVTYTYDATTKRLRREATTGANLDFTLLQGGQAECTSFAFSYFTTTDAAPTDQGAPGTYVPYSIKQIEVTFVLESPSASAAGTRTRYQATSSRFLFRNRTLTDGT